MKRELLRVRDQMFAPITETYNRYLETGIHDFKSRSTDVVSQGTTTLNKKLCIYVIFSKKGIQRSHIAAIDTLNQTGFAVLVVSNLPLNPTDHETLRPICWKILERKNHGYDFGGYRQGVLLSHQHFPRLDRLVLLNDSVWVIPRNFADWLQDLETRQLDYVGSISHFGRRADDSGRDIRAVWESSRRQPEFHYGSFALSISGKVLMDDRFLEFWKSYRLSNIKSDTVRRGEIGLTEWIIAHGFSHGETFDVDALPRELANLDDAAVADITSHLVFIHNRKKFLRWRTAIQENKMTRPEQEELILSTAAEQGPGFSLIYYLISKWNFPFLKKLPVSVNEDLPGAFVEICKALDETSRDLIWPEISDMLRDRKPDPRRL
jgi:lipopolysaccharide biosynthesis protein